ncbi:MAG TPA: shikimate dehydrogenase [bacterium]|jgi:shikimate dehydrogenase
MSTSLRLGLLGRDISYSLSPAIFEWGFRTTDISGTYVIHDVPEEHLAPLIESNAWDGLNVTIPYKAAALRFCQQVTVAARDAGAVNTLYRKDGDVWGDNTDLAGFGYAVARRKGAEEHFHNVLVIGSGGAARAVVVALSKGYHRMAITVASRDAARARRRLSEYVESADLSFASLENARESLEGFDLIVNATPSGSRSCPGSPLAPPLHFNPASLVMDLIYEPRKTLLLQAADERGARTENGLVMLLAQAAASFQIWTGREFPLKRALTEFLPRLESYDPLSHGG